MGSFPRTGEDHSSVRQSFRDGRPYSPPGPLGMESYIQSRLFQPVTTGIPSISTTLWNTSKAPDRMPVSGVITGRLAPHARSLWPESRDTDGGSSSLFSHFSFTPLGSWQVFPGSAFLHRDRSRAGWSHGRTSRCRLLRNRFYQKPKSSSVSTCSLDV